MKERPLISIVVPVFNEEESLSSLVARTNRVFERLGSYAWNYIFVNDGSTDSSLELLKAMASTNNNVRVIDLSRNFGKEVALSAGVIESEAAAVICMDADLQHPPEVIPELIERWEAGVEIVATRRISMEGQPALRRLGSSTFYWLMNKISDVEMSPDTTDFRLFDRKTVDVFKLLTERGRMFRGIFDWMGFHKEFVEFHADARTTGEARYSYLQLFRLAMNSITSFSLFPLRLTGYLGLIVTFLSSMLGIWMLITRYFINEQMFTPLSFVVVANTFLIGLVLTSIGLIALYIGNIHAEVANRPLYIIRERINFD